MSEKVGAIDNFVCGQLFVPFTFGAFFQAPCCSLLPAIVWFIALFSLSLSACVCSSAHNSMSHTHLRAHHLFFSSFFYFFFIFFLSLSLHTAESSLSLSRLRAKINKPPTFPARLMRLLPLRVCLCVFCCCRVHCVFESATCCLCVR